LKPDCGKDRISDQPSFKKIKIESSVLFIFTKLTTQSLCSVSIVKRGHLLLPIFGFPQKNEKIQKNIKKIIGARKGCWNAEKTPKLVEEIQKYKRLKFDSESPVDKKNSI
jgi:hypothetical protein